MEELVKREGDVAFREAMVARKENTLLYEKEIYVHVALARLFQQLALAHQDKIERLEWERSVAAEDNEEQLETL